MTSARASAPRAPAVGDSGPPPPAVGSAESRPQPARSTTRLLVIGVGNRYRRDDGVGPLIVERIRDSVSHPCDAGSQRVNSQTGGTGSRPEHAPARGQGVQPVNSVTVTTKLCSGEGGELMAAWEDADAVWLIDAIRAADAPGRIVRLDAATQTIPSDFFRYSTHAFSVAEAVELARVLGTLPPHLIIIGVEGADFTSGEGLSLSVAAATEQVLRQLRDEMDAASDPFGDRSPSGGLGFAADAGIPGGTGGTGDTGDTSGTGGTGVPPVRGGRGGTGVPPVLPRQNRPPN